MPAKKRKLPNVNHMFLNRMGLKYVPSQNFVDKFKEYFLEEVYKNKQRQHITIDDNKAIYFINCILEAITYCLDFGFGVYIPKIMMFDVKTTDYRHNVKSHILSVVEDVKKINFALTPRLHNNIRKLINKDNKEYCEYIKGKEKRFKEIKDYYKEFYGKQDEWWQDN